MRTATGQEMRIVQESVARLNQKQISPFLEALNHYPDSGDPRNLVTPIQEMGFFSLFDESADDGNISTLSLILETLADTAAAPASMLLAHCLARWTLHAAGIPAPAGILGCAAYVEPGHCDGKLLLKKAGTGQTLTGRCRFIVNATIAGSLLVLARREDNPAERCLILVDAVAEGVVISKPLLTLGMRGCPVADVTFNSVKVDPRHCAADGVAVMQKGWRRFRGPAAAITAGIAGSSLRHAAGYAQERYQGGKQIIEHQQVRSMLADMLSDYQTCCEAADRLSAADVQADGAGAGLFIRAKECAARAATDGVQLLGGYGYMEDYGQERRMRDAKQAQCLLGRCDPLRQEQIKSWLETDSSR